MRICGVRAHHQNGIAEKRIGDLQRRATTLLLHALRRWQINVKLKVILEKIEYIFTPVDAAFIKKNK
jgi:hypothetical protein